VKSAFDTAYLLKLRKLRKALIKATPLLTISTFRSNLHFYTLKCSKGQGFLYRTFHSMLRVFINYTIFFPVCKHYLISTIYEFQFSCQTQQYTEQPAHISLCLLVYDIATYFDSWSHHLVKH
jgi:hypothetical protein